MHRNSSMNPPATQVSSHESNLPKP